MEIDQKKLNKLVEMMKVLNRDITKNQLQIEQLEQILRLNHNLDQYYFALDRLTSQLLHSTNLMTIQFVG